MYHTLSQLKCPQQVPKARFRISMCIRCDTHKHDMREGVAYRLGFVLVRDAHLAAGAGFPALMRLLLEVSIACVCCL